MTITIHNTYIESDLVCRKPIADSSLAVRGLFKYFDKDGYELSDLEVEFYKAQGFTVDWNNRILDNNAWAQDHISIDDKRLVVDHSMILQRAKFEDDALAQIYYGAAQYDPRMLLIAQQHSRWGIDFNLFFHDLDTNRMEELLHIESEDVEHEPFLICKSRLEEIVIKTDWADAWKSMLKRRDEWISEPAFFQHLWKADFVGWDIKHYFPIPLT